MSEEFARQYELGKDSHEQEAEGTLQEGVQEPTLHEWDVPTLHQTCIQANANLVRLEPSNYSTFDYWFKNSTLAFRKPLLVPVKLADYHKEQITDPQTGKARKLNTSVTLNKRSDGWWLTLSYDEVVPLQTEPDTPVIGVDVGIANFVTSSDGRHCGTFHGKLCIRVGSI